MRVGHSVADSTGEKIRAHNEKAPNDWKVGDKIRFAEERISYTVQAISASGRYMACTKPFLAMARTAVMYTMVDWVAGVRGVDNSLGNSLGYETREDCEEAVDQFERGEFEFSGRRRPIPIVLVPLRKRTERSKCR